MMLGMAFMIAECIREVHKFVLLLIIELINDHNQHIVKLCVQIGTSVLCSSDSSPLTAVELN